MFNGQLEFSESVDEQALSDALNEWKEQHVKLQIQRSELDNLKRRRDREKDDAKRRTLRQHIRRLVDELNGRIRPWDYFTTEELHELKNTESEDDGEST